jgi:hypothetical protein
MSPDEMKLFSLIDNARTGKGCAPLRRNSNLSGSARTDADQRAQSGSVSGSESSMAAAGGDNWDAQTAFNRMMDQNSSVILNCGLTTLGVGRGTATHDVGSLCPLPFVCTTKTRVGWVAAFQ